MKDMILNHRWNEFIREIPIHKGDFFQIEPGCLHAIKGGTLILETQQNSDITYRVYDYDRLQNGKPRDLHIQQSIDVIKAPYNSIIVERKSKTWGNITREKLVSCEYYTVEKLDITGKVELEQLYKFMNVSVIKGKGTIDGISIEKGEHFIIPFNYGIANINGELTVIISYIP